MKSSSYSTLFWWGSLSSCARNTRSCSMRGGQPFQFIFDNWMVHDQKNHTLFFTVTQKDSIYELPCAFRCLSVLRGSEKQYFGGIVMRTLSKATKQSRIQGVEVCWAFGGTSSVTRGVFSGSSLWPFLWQSGAKCTHAEKAEPTVGGENYEPSSNQFASVCIWKSSAQFF